MIEFFCPGRPQAQGSKVATRWGMREVAKELGPWRERVALAAHAAMNGQALLAGPVTLGLEFILYRPLATPRKSTPPATKAPDIDKLERAINDALTGVCFSNDAQVTMVFKRKRVANLGESPGVHVWVVEGP